MIYIVFRPYEDCLLAAFSSLEKADEYVKNHQYSNELTIETLEIDECLT